MDEKRAPRRVTVGTKHELEKAVVKSARKSTVQFPGEFARITKPGQDSTLLSFLFSQGEVAMKLYLTLVMLTASAVEDKRWTGQQKAHGRDLYRLTTDLYWAELLGYEDPDDGERNVGAGVRRIRRGMTTLATMGNKWITRTKVPARGWKITVLHADTSKRMRKPYITLPIELWSKGWIVVMSARALFVYMCLRLAFVGVPESEGIHVSTWDREQFAIKDDTWDRGLDEVKALGLVRVVTDKVTSGDRHETDRRQRRIYYLNHTYLRENDSPTTPVGWPED